jgi:hypothetical protein
VTIAGCKAEPYLAARNAGMPATTTEDDIAYSESPMASWRPRSLGRRVELADTRTLAAPLHTVR